MKKYKIYNSTNGTYNGLTFECDVHNELCIECLDNALGYKLVRNKIEKKEDIYIYQDGHMILLLKEVK